MKPRVSPLFNDYGPIEKDLHLIRPPNQIKVIPQSSVDGVGQRVLSGVRSDFSSGELRYMPHLSTALEPVLLSSVSPYARRV